MYQKGELIRVIRKSNLYGTTAADTGEVGCIRSKTINGQRSISISLSGRRVGYENADNVIPLGGMIEKYVSTTHKEPRVGDIVYKIGSNSVGYYGTIIGLRSTSKKKGPGRPKKEPRKKPTSAKVIWFRKPARSPFYRTYEEFKDNTWCSLTSISKIGRVGRGCTFEF